MILFSPATGVMLSDIFGFEGSTELRRFAKKMRLDRSALRDEGHPVDEHYIIPPAKFFGMGDRGAKIITLHEHISLKGAKQASVNEAISSAKALPMVRIELPDDDYHPPSFAARRRDRQKNWRQPSSQEA